MKSKLLSIWQFPQNIAGWLMTRYARMSTCIRTNDGLLTPVYFTDNVYGCGVSLGNYIILDFEVYGKLFVKDSKYFYITVNHEHGHQRQSKRLGIFYLFVIGIPSAIGNLIDRWFLKGWSDEKREKWYYSLPWEAWADKLGEVNRF